MDEAERLADDVVILDRGRVVATGTPHELTAGLDTELRFTGPPRLGVTSLRAALPEAVRVEEPRPGQYRVTGPVDPQVIATVTAWCASHRVMPEGLQVGRRTLEDVFLERTGRSLRP
jgi:ABC-2 type transport system ATP-binding protein